MFVVKSMKHIPYHSIDWSFIESTSVAGETGFCLSKTLNFGSIRIRLLEYSANYLADHWCTRGHLVFCLEGEFESHLRSGEVTQLRKGMSYFVSDNKSTHRSFSKSGAQLLIVEGDFLK